MLVGEHLAGLGRRRLLFLGDTAHTEVAERLAGLTAAVAGQGVEIRQVSLHLRPWARPGGRR